MTRTKIKTCYAGETEDYFTVIAETASGRRFASFPNGQSPGMFPTMERAERFAARIMDTGSIDITHWVELNPIYGSAAFIDQQDEACVYAEAIRAGYINETEVPYTVRTLL